MKKDKKISVKDALGKVKGKITKTKSEDDSAVDILLDTDSDNNTPKKLVKPNFKSIKDKAVKLKDTVSKKGKTSDSDTNSESALIRLAYKIRENVKIIDLKNFNFDFNLKVQLIVGFLVPVIFVVIVGISAYNKAEDGMTESYENTALVTISTQMDYLDFGLTLIRNDAVQLKLDTEIQSYFGGTYRNDKSKGASVKNKTNSTVTVKQSLNKFINNIYFIPKSEFEIISTDKTGIKGTQMPAGFYEEWSNTEEGKAINSSQITGWISYHPELDSRTGYNPDEYLLSFVTAFPNKCCVLAVDINAEAIRENISTIDVSDGAIVAFVTADGKEIVVKEEYNNTDISVFEQDFYQEIVNGDELSGTEYVKIDRKDYLFIYKTSEETGATLAYLVPKAKVIASALEIKTLTIILVIISCIVAIILGLAIILNITLSMNSIIKRIKKVAEGDLTVQMKTKGNSEFATLNKHIANMIDNTRNLIVGVEHIVDAVGDSTHRLEQVSGEMIESSKSISGALIEIDAGVGQQAEDSQDCLIQMDKLSEVIYSVVEDINSTAKNSENNKKIVAESIVTMDTLSKQNDATIKITSKVKDDVRELEQKAKEISKFVGVISDIAFQTNLLSLNASIEAARAGEMGKGFSVVAEEVRKLADESKEAANEISKLVGVIGDQAHETADATVKAEEIVKEQSNTVADIKIVFENISKATDAVISDIHDVESKVKGMDAERVGTLESISSISAVSEETSALSSNLSEVVQGQQEVVDSLTTASKELQTNTDELKQAISVFKTTEDTCETEEK